MSLIVTYYYQKIDHQRNCIVKTKGPMKLRLNNGNYIGHPNRLPMVVELLKVVLPIILLKHEAFCQLSTLLWNSSIGCKEITKWFK
jgi:hypothetical protein